MASPYKASFALAPSNTSILPGSLCNDLLIWTGNSNQNILFGVSNVNTYLSVSGAGDLALSGNLTFSNQLQLSGIMLTQRTSATINNATSQVTAIDGLTYLNGDVLISMSNNQGSNTIRFLQNSTEYMRISSNGYVGIRTSNPLYNLDVTGTTRIYNSNPDLILHTTMNDSNSTGSILFANSGGNFTHRIRRATRGIGSANADLIFSTGLSTEPSNLQDVLTIGRNCNVGIGTSNPSYPLHVMSNMQVQGVFSGNSNYLQHGRIYFNDTNFGIGCGNFSGSNAVGDNLYLWAFNGIGRDIVFSHPSVGLTNPGTWPIDMIIQGGTGYVGIGKSNPAYNLDVTGIIKIYNSNPDLILQTTNNAASNSGSILFQNSGGNYSWRIGRRGDNVANSGLPNLTFSGGSTTEPSNLTDIMALSPSGYIGIGTSNPSSLLHLATTVGLSNNISNIGGANLMTFSDDRNYTCDLYILCAPQASGGGVGWASKVLGVNISSTFSNNRPTKRTTLGGTVNSAAISLSADINPYAIGFHTASNATPVSSNLNLSMCITSAGNVGIGLSNPTQKLEVNGVINVFDSGNKSMSGGIATEVNGGLINFGINDTRFGSYNSANQYGIVRVDSRNAFPAIQFHTAGAGQASALVMSILANGNVGINDAAPNNKLVVNGSTWLNGATYINGDTRPSLDNTSSMGTATFRWNAVYAVNGTIQTSDEKDKDSIPLPYGINDLMKISTIKYKWKTQIDLPDDDPRKNYEYFGICARELDTIFPELVYNETEPFQINYSELMPICIKAIQDLKKEKDELSNSLIALETIINDKNNIILSMQTNIQSMQSNIDYLLNNK